MSERNQAKKKGKSILLKGGENPVFLSVQKDGLQIAQKIENKQGIRLLKTNKGVYYVIDIPADGCLKLSYIALKKVVGSVLKMLKQQKKKGVEEVSFEELLSEGSSKSKKEAELEEVPFE